MPTRQASARASRRRYESTPERGQGRRREDPRGLRSARAAIARAALPGRKKINVCARNSSARSPIPTSRAIAIVCSIIRRSKAARIPPQRLVGADDSVRPSPPQRSKPPLCKGRWHGEAVTEGLLKPSMALIPSGAARQMPAGTPGRGSDMPPACHSLPRPRFAAP